MEKIKKALSQCNTLVIKQCTLMFRCPLWIGVGGKRLALIKILPRHKCIVPRIIIITGDRSYSGAYAIPVP